MIFDALCSIADNHLPHLGELVRKAHLFAFPGRAHEILSKERFTKEKVDFINETFFLPYQHVAVEDTASCCVIWDTAKNVIGAKNERRFIDCSPFNSRMVRELQASSVEQGIVDLTAQKLDEFCKESGVFDGYTISVGNIITWWAGDCDSQSGARRIVDGMITSSWFVSRDSGILKAFSNNDLVELSPEILRFVGVAFGEVLYFNSPDRFVLKRSPLKERDPRKSVHIPRSHERPVYTLLTPKEIREKLSIEEPSELIKHVSPHERRQHYRSLRSEVYTHKKGQTIIIPATWVGPSEKTIGRHHYKVVLDK
jgi:hypothetical protein